LSCDKGRADQAGRLAGYQKVDDHVLELERDRVFVLVHRLSVKRPFIERLRAVAIRDEHRDGINAAE
jgi:hypothetical protein